jgi:3-dehydroquinate synthase
LHGEAVLLDIIISTVIALRRCLLTEEDANRIFNLIDDLGITLDTSLLDPETLWQSLEERTCHRNGFQRVPLPRGLGNCVFINDITQREIQSTYQSLINRREIQHDRV